MNLRKLLSGFIILLFFIMGTGFAGLQGDKKSSSPRNIIVTINGLDQQKALDLSLNKIIYQKILKIENSHIIVANKNDIRTLVKSTQLFHFNLEFEQHQDKIKLKAQLYDESHKKLIKGLIKKDILKEQLIDYTERALTILISELNEA